jgi:hypothetical protein
MNMRKIDEIIIHCSATRDGWMSNATPQERVEEIRRWHVDGNGWDDIGYHFIIDRDGTITPGRDKDHDGDIWEEIGAHVRGRNRTTLGVCLIGGHGSNENDAFLHNYTPAQEHALLGWIEGTTRKFPSIKRVSGHNEYAAKACPGFNVRRWIDGKAPRTSPAQSKTIQATAGTAVATGTAAITGISQLDGTAQIIVAVAAIAAGVGLAIIFRERLRKWARGDR